MSFSSSTRNHEVIDFANSCCLLSMDHCNPSDQADRFCTGHPTTVQATNLKESSLLFNYLDSNPSLFVLSSSQPIPSEATLDGLFHRHAFSLLSDAATKHPVRINTAPAMGTVTAFQNADDPESPTSSQAMFPGRYAYSDHTKAHNRAFWRFFKLCFTPMFAWTACRSGHAPARPIPHHGQTTPKNHCRVTANIPKQRRVAQRRSPSTIANPEPTVAPKDCDRGPRARRDFGFQGGRDDWSAIFQVARGCAA